MGKKQINRNRQWPILVLLFLGSILIRAIMAWIVRSGQIVIIDEGLYTNLARSLAFEGRAAFRSQPVNYPYLLYPLSLVPVYRLNALIGGPIYRFVQAYNAILYSVSVFPAYALGKAFTGKEKSGVTAALLMALLPEGVMVSLTLSEALLWPLTLTAAYFGYRFISEGKKSHAVFAGLFTGLSYFTKPGAAIWGGVLLLCLLIFRKDRRKNTLFGLLSLLVTAILGYAISSLLCGNFTLIGLYTKQTSDWVPSHALIALGSTALMCVMLAAALSGTFFIMPFLNLKQYDKDRRDMVIFTAAGTLAMIIGTAIFVTPYKWEGEMLFLRYIAPCLPLFIIFTLGAESTKNILGKNFQLWILIFTGLFAIAGTITALTGTIPAITHNCAASAFVQNSRINGKAVGLTYTAVLCIFTLTVALSGKDLRFFGSTKKVLTIGLAVVFVFSNICGYIGASVPLPEGVAADAEELNLMRGDTTALGIIGQRYDDILSYWEEGSMTYPMQQVTFDQMAVTMMETGGIYSPFVPLDQAPNKENQLTTDTDVFVLGQTVREHMELNESVSVQTTTNGIYAMAKIVPGERWVDTMMYGLDGNKLSPEKEAAIFIYDERQGEMTASIDVVAPETGAVITISQNGYGQEQTVSGTATLTFTGVADIVQISTTEEVNITGYSTK